ncbi:PGPGW domain-containing protein [Ornithinimicrobium sp. Y1847]|uniref:PGPGW domain-containing protein n=1 Tax=Ornithinimicrobium sp. Y1847 TaxID=3405419 RepID=UPI003B673580
MRDLAAGAAKRIVLEVLGWTVLAVGIVALFLPGPGLLLTFCGLAILSTQYLWARNLMAPVRIKALRGAAEGVQTPLRIVLSACAALTMTATGIFWLLDPPTPTWWPLRDAWWLFGGPAVGWTLVGSSLIALGLLVYSVRRFYGRPDAVAEVDRLEEAHRAEVAARRAERV